MLSKAAGLLACLLLACGGSEKPTTSPDGEGHGADDADDDDDGQIELGDRSQTTRQTRLPTLDDDEDDPDEPGVEVKGLKGRLDPYDIESGVAPHSGTLAACYSDNLKRRKYLGGDISFKFTIARSGDVKMVQIAKSDLGAWDVEKCMLGVARQMTFVKPKGGEADFTLPLEFDATRSARWLDEDIGNAQVKELTSELKGCSKETKTKRPRKVMVTLYVGPRGQVTSVGFASPAKRPIDDLWADCAETKVRAWVLSDPLGRIAKIAFQWN